MLPVLEAERRLEAIDAITTGASGRMAPEDYRRVIADLQRQAGRRPRARKATAADLAALGITVTKQQQ